jgi:transcriptional regulator with XRE-family HTH domain
MSSDQTQVSQVSSLVGRRIQKRREQMGLSLRTLAGQSGVTASFLSQVERGQTTPSLNSLKGIAETLQVPLFYLLIEDNSDGHLVRDGCGARLLAMDADVDYEIRSPGQERKILAFVARCQPGYRRDALSPGQSTEECIYVIRGSLRVELEDGGYVIETGDSITFDGLALRCLAVAGDRETVYLAFSTPPALW